MRLFRRLAALAALPLVVFAASGAQAEEGVTSFTLENGLEVVVIEDHRAPLVVHMVWYRAGAADEPPGKSGIAHYLEHLMFKGTEKVPDGTFSDIVAAEGGSDNAFTSWDYTAYFQRVAADRLEMVMEMEADRMRNLILTEEKAATEREVILEERAQRTDSDPGALLGEQMRAMQFLNHRYGIPIIGWRHEMEGLTYQDALDWYRRYYAPNNAILIVAGDADPEEVRRLAEKHYGPLEPSPDIVPRARPQEPPPLAERRITLADPRVSDAYVYRSYLAPERDPGDQKEAAALVILAELLGGDGTTSYLARKLQFERPVAVWTSAFYDGNTIDDGTFGVFVLPAPGVTLAEAEAALDETLAAFLAEGADPAAFERIKTQIRASEIYARDNVDGLARRYGEELAIGLSVQDVQEFDDILNAVTLEEVMAAAGRVMDRRAAVTGWLTRPEDPAAPAATPASAATGD